MITATQKKQHQFLSKMLEKEIRFGLNQTNTYNCTCNDCGENISTHVVENAIRFLNQHEGHRTWVTTGGFVDSVQFVR